MDTKEAIDFTKRIKHSGNGYGNSYISDFNKLEDVITLLQRGEKYRQMWGELEKEKCLLIDFDDEGYFKGQRKLDDIKQKYFPKEAEKDTETSGHFFVDQYFKEKEAKG